MLRPHPATFGWPGVVVFVSAEGKPIHWTNFRRRIWLPAVRAAGVVIGPEIRKVGQGSAHLAVDADVFEGSGNRIGELTEICDSAINAWEEGLARLGLISRVSHGWVWVLLSRG